MVTSNQGLIYGATLNKFFANKYANTIKNS